MKILKTFKIWVFFEAIDGLFEKKLNFQKIAKGSKFAVECDLNSNISQNVQNLGFFLKKIAGFFEKNLHFFLKIAKSSKFVV